MLSTVVLPWLHYVAVLLMAGALVAELYVLKLGPSPDTVRLLARVDIMYGGSATIVLVTGLLRMWHGGKGADWYLHNGIMHGLLTLFIATALVSLVPTLRYLRWRKAVNAGGGLPDARAWKSTRGLVHVQLAAITAMTLLITMVAKGHGHFGT